MPTRARVVLIDDDANLLRALTDLLTEHGITVAATATDGCQALPALFAAADRHGGIDALVIDERMPHTSGLEATRLVRRLFPTLPVILHTAYAGLLGGAPHKAGVTLQVSKADHPLTLVSAIRAVVDAAMAPA